MLKLSVLILAAILVACSAEWKACQKDGFRIASSRDGKPITCKHSKHSNDRPKKCSSVEEQLGYCDSDPTNTTAFCCVAIQDCSEKKCPNGTLCVEEKDDDGATFAKCIGLTSSSSTPTPTSATPSTSCKGVIDKGRCYDPLCLPPRRRSRLQIMLKMNCESTPGYMCVKEKKNVRCLDKEGSPPTATTTTTSSTTISAATTITTSSPSIISDGPTSGTDNPTSETVLCIDINIDDQDDDDDKGDTVKCPKRFVYNKGKCVHKKCVRGRRNRINKCEKDGKFYCMKDDVGRIDCKACDGLEENGICTVSDCIKPNTTSAVTKCKEFGGVCRKIGRVVTCTQGEKPGNKSHRSICLPKVNGRKGNKTDDDMKGSRNKTDEKPDNKGDSDDDKGDGKGDRKDDKGDHKDDKGDRKDDKGDDKDDKGDRKDDKGDDKDDKHDYDDDDKDDDDDDDKDDDDDDKDDDDDDDKDDDDDDDKDDDDDDDKDDDDDDDKDDDDDDDDDDDGKKRRGKKN